MKKCNIGGQAVLEGVMMKSPERIAIAVRRSDGQIEIVRQKADSIQKRYKCLGFPIIRGMVTFFETMIIGIRALMISAELYDDDAEDYEPSKFERFVSEKTGKSIEDVMIASALVLALAFAVLLFIIIPTTVTSFLGRHIESSLVKNLLEGLIRLIIFILYIVAVSRLKDIRRVFEYHGAEHKTIHCYEHGEDLTVENARKYTTLHPRCGTAFLLIVMVLSIVVFSFFGWHGILMRILTRVLLLPIISGISYEMIKWAGKSESGLVNIVMYPGLMLQKLTTKEPDDTQIEVAIKAFLAATAGDEYEEKTECDGNCEKGPDKA
ncbi:MAG: DUF1385 domain-containing protein [Clostridiales bacterium]|nr:DUF1385 domain-containing protein [Clostridiales bacterium]